MKRGNVRKFGREFQQRKALLKALLTSLVEHDRIRTTEARAKTLKRAADKLVTTAKKGTVASRRLLLRDIGTKAAAKLSREIAPRYADRHGGYTRVLHMEARTSDAARMALIEFVK